MLNCSPIWIYCICNTIIYEFKWLMMTIHSHILKKFVSTLMLYMECEAYLYFTFKNKNKNIIFILFLLFSCMLTQQSFQQFRCHVDTYCVI